jgi:hypothetical protein
MTGNKMLNPNAQKWVNALESGEYKQTRNSLTNEKNTRFCCLGVACDLYRKEFGGNWDTKGEDFTFMGHSELLPSVVKGWLGLETRSGSFPYPTGTGKRVSLSELNDSGWSRKRRGWNFRAIARLIKKEPKGLFENE